MAELKGTNLVVSVSTTLGGTYYQVGSMNDATMTIDGDNQDITAFGDDWIKRLQGLKDASYSLSGFRDVADTNGQVVISTALINDSALFAKFLPDGTNGFVQEVKVSSFEVSGAVDGIVELSMDFEGSGAIAATP